MDTLKLNIEYVDIDSIRVYPHNAKTHPSEQIEQIKKSIVEFGMNDPLGIVNGEICEGHGRYIACKELGFTTVPIIRLDHLSDEQKRAYALVHNKLTINSGFDVDLLWEELQALDFNMKEFGFEMAEPVFNEEDFDSQEDNHKEEEQIQCPHCKMWFTLK